MFAIGRRNATGALRGMVHGNRGASKKKLRPSVKHESAPCFLPGRLAFKLEKANFVDKGWSLESDVTRENFKQKHKRKLRNPGPHRIRKAVRHSLVPRRAALAAIYPNIFRAGPAHHATIQRPRELSGCRSWRAVNRRHYRALVSISPWFSLALSVAAAASQSINRKATPVRPSKMPYATMPFHDPLAERHS